MKRRQEGVTLIELMISLVLGLLVAGLAIQLLLQSRNSQSTQEATSYLQESARYVVYRLRPIIRNAGYAGCANVRGLVGSEDVDREYDISQPFGGSQASYKGESYWKLSFVAAEKFGSDVPLSAPMTGLGSEIVAGDFLNTDYDYRGDFKDVVDASGVALVTDCEAADIFALDPDPADPSGSTYAIDDGALGVKVTPKTALSQLYGSGNSANSYLYPIRRWELELRDQTTDTNEPALFLVDVDGPSGTKYNELVSGIKEGSYKVTVSLDTDGDGQPDELKQDPAAVNTADTWNQIVRVELAFTLRSQPGVVPGGDNDGRLERQFQLTFSPRNLQLR